MYNNISSKVMDGIRLRVRESTANILPEHKDDQRKLTHNFRYLPMIHLTAIICFLISISIAVILFERQLPTPLLKKDELRKPNKFIAERAMDYLIKLTNIGPRPTGSYENEVLAVNFFVDEITATMRKAKPIHSVLLDVQKASGAFTLTFFDGMTNVYRNVQNVIVKVGPNTGSPHSVLINCHFDTVSDSPGASDDGASCAIMLEILSVITQMDKPLKHNLILLFNGAEENLMQASHGFITKHQWAKEVRAFINLEACGAGGREILFQAGPNHPWIMETYSQSVPYPYASSLAQEIFQSGVIPGDTDFRIFRDFGQVSGLDFAWSKNGYVYHTKLDNVHQIPLGTLQRTGENILALSVAMANNDKLANTAKYASGNLVFFDFLGAIVLRWPELTGFFINMCGVALSVYSIFRNLKTASEQGMGYRKYLSQLGISVVVIMISILLSLLANLLTAVFLTLLGCTMSWYSQPIWVFFLYICPVIIVPMAAMSAWYIPAVGSPWVHFQMYNDAGLIIWTFTEFICTVLHIRSAFIALLWILFLSLDNIFQSTVFRHKRGSRWLIFYVGARLLPFLQCLYLILGATALYIPIMGRSGAGNNAEILVALLIGTKFSMLFMSFLPLILLVRDQKQILGVLSAVFLAALALLIFTPLGFPYSSDPVSPAPQRFMLAHTHRMHHDAENKVHNNESGYWIVDMDQNSPFSLKSLVPEIAQAKQIVEDCKHELYCGLPYLMPVLSFIWKTHWIPSSMPDIPVRTHLYLNKSEITADHFKRLTFTITGPDHLGVMLSPASGMKLERWSLLDEHPLAGPLWNGRDTYFIYYSCASDPEPWTFWIDLKGPTHVNQTSLDIAVTSHFLHGKAKVSPNFHQFVAQFPQWTAVTAWTATYESWKF